MATDARGLALTGSDAAAVHLDAAIAAYCGLRRDTGEHLKRALAADPRLVLGHVLRGAFMLLFATASATPRAVASARTARETADATGANPRERAHLAALERWIAGDLGAAGEGWSAILEDWPRDLLAMKLAQHCTFYLGRSEAMRAATARAVAALGPGEPGHNFALGCHAFSLEECGDLAEADRCGRRAVALDPTDIWAAHAVAHVAEMEDRAEDGLAWIAAQEPHWREVNNFHLHVRWHRCLFLLERGRADEALALYDREVWPAPSDDYLDISNAVSLLWRLEREGCAVGGRWAALAAASKPHLRDHCLVFADLHYLIALAAVEDPSVPDWLEASRAHSAEASDDTGRVFAAVGIALGEAAIAHRKRDWRTVCAVLAPVRGEVRRIGGSHAQRDLFDQMLIDAALVAEPELARTLLAERLARRPRNAWGRARAQGLGA